MATPDLFGASSCTVGEVARRVRTAKRRVTARAVDGLGRMLIAEDSTAR